MKKTIILFALLCVNIMAWGQTEYGKEQLRDAQAGDAKAQYWVSWYYENGKEGFPKDEQESIKWLKESAENGYAKAQYDLGGLYCYGNRGLPKDKNEYLKWCKKAADGGYDLAYFSLGLYYNETNKQEAIYWFKKSMDAWYEEYGEEYDLSAEELRKLGVVYHPKKRSKSMTSSSSSGSSGSSGSSSSKKSSSECLYSATYTISGTGFSSTGQTIDGLATIEEVQFFDDHIMVGSLYCKYLRTSGSWKVYEGMSMSGMGMSSEDYYYVNSNYGMKKVTKSVGPYMMETFTYSMTRGESSDGGYGNGNYSGNSNGTGNSGGTSSRRERTSPTQNPEHACGTCKGSKKCIVCKGNKRLYNIIVGRGYYTDCTSCNATGICTVCNGTGRSTKMYNY